MERPFIHVFSTSENFYLYDVNTNEVTAIDKEVAVYLREIELGKVEVKANSNIQEVILQLQRKGLLKLDRPEHVKHPTTDLLPSLLSYKLRRLVLQVTQKCNLRCEYCVYSGEYTNRQHSELMMSWETARKAIDYVLSHSEYSPELAFSFYGGEPLIAFDLIRRCVEYIRDAQKGRQVYFAMTTNATLMTKEIAEFLAYHKFGLTISLDGPESVHNRHRKFAYSQIGSFEKVIKSLNILREAYGTDYYSKVSINSVVDPEFDCKSTIDFVDHDNTVMNTKFTINMVGEEYSKSSKKVSNEFLANYKYEIFKAMLNRLGRLERKSVSKFADVWYENLQTRLFDRRSGSNTVRDIGHHSGPCIAGVNKLFVNVFGEFYPCERVSETSDICKLGQVDSGIDRSKADMMINIERFTHEKCRDCWCYRFCSSCIKSIDGFTEIDKKRAYDICNKNRASTEELLKDYCCLMELGCDYYNEIKGKIIVV